MSRNADRVIRDKRYVLRVMEMLNDPMIVEIVRRAGKRERDVKSSDRVSVSRGSISDPTGSSVVEQLTLEEEGHAHQDALFEAGRTLAHSMKAMADAARVVEQSAHFVLEIQERTKKAETAHCLACGREVACTPKDPLKSGYCNKDYMTWYRQERPNRTTFEAEIKALVNESLSVHNLD